MNINFALLLVSLVVMSGAITLIDLLFFSKTRKNSSKEIPWYVDYARSFFPILLIVLLLRSFILEPFRIPSGSLEPTLLVGDFILVNKYQYGLRLPVLNQKIVDVSAPKVGDITVFRWPPNPKIDYIKRIIGKSGDHIQYINKQLIVNGKPAKQQFIKYTTDMDTDGHVSKVEQRVETLNGIRHSIYIRPDVPIENFDVTVPAGKYFAMGDNRDDSSDSRRWGFIPEENLVGKAWAVWMSWDKFTDNVRWRRIGGIIR